MEDMIESAGSILGGAANAAESLLFSSESEPYD